MPLHRSFQPLWLLPVVLAGCSTTMGSKFGGTPQSRSIAVVGERPLPASTGEPGGRVVADNEEPEPRRNPKTRISGRVVDEAGEAVPGATVRLADGAVKGGKEIRGVTDRSGGFTLNGLRTGSTYVLIAEAEDDKGPLIGRVEAKTSETGVEISLGPEGKKAATSRSARPSKTKPISERTETESDEATDPDGSPRVNREDVSPIVEESDAIDPGPIPVGRPKLAPPDPGVGWKNSKTTATRPQDQDVEGEVTTSDASSRRPRSSDDPTTSESDEGVNPLPPAIDPDAGATDSPRTPSTRNSKPRKTSAKVDPKSFEREAGDMALAPRASLEGQANRSRSNDEPSSHSRSLSSLMPDGDLAPSRSTEVAASVATSKMATTQAGPPDLPPVGEPAVIVAAEAPSPTPSPPAPASQHQDDASSKPASQPVFASQVAATKPIEKHESPAAYNPFANIAPGGLPPDRVVDNPPIGQLSPGEDRAAPVASVSTLDESPKKKWGELVSTERPSVMVEPTKATTSGSFLRRKRSPSEGRDPSIALCSYDTRLRKINDFRLPDLEGKPVRFQDFDADYVLIDFWGTWCGPCLDSIPHLVALQKKYGPDKLKVVGIACEEVPPELRKVKVDEVSRKFGINYPILLSTMDGKPCPVQQALQIQAMPTMILVDRRGQVLWRNSGATSEAESRLDRVLALSMSRGNTTVRR